MCARERESVSVSMSERFNWKCYLISRFQHVNNVLNVKRKRDRESEREKKGKKVATLASQTKWDGNKTVNVNVIKSINILENVCARCTCVFFRFIYFDWELCRCFGYLNYFAIKLLPRGCTIEEEKNSIHSICCSFHWRSLLCTFWSLTM